MPRIAIEQGRIVVTGTRYAMRDALKSVPGGRWSAERRAWTYPATPLVARALHAALTAAHLTPDVRALIDDARKIVAAQTAKRSDTLAKIEGAKLSPWLHQQRAFYFARDARAAMLAMDMGTGKSAVVVWLVKALSLSRVLITCPVSVLDVWPEQFAKHCDDPAPRVIVLDRDTSVAARAVAAQRELDLAKIEHVSAVIIINHEALWREPFGAFALRTQWDLVVVDESHRAKRPSGRFSLFLSHLREHATRKLCLTGTPMPHSPLDIYAQFRFLEPGVFGTSFVRFRNRYAEMGGYGGHEVTGYKNEDELARKMNELAFMVSKDVLDLPDVQHVERRCTLTREQRTVYRDLEQQLIAEVQGGVVTAANALVKLLRLQQVTGGFVKLEEGEEVQLDSAKETLLSDVLEDFAEHEPVVVFARFHADLDTVHRVAKKQRRSCGELSGRCNDLKRWRDGELDVLAVQIQAGGVGVDMSRARYCIFYSTGYSLGEYEQACARVHRPGQTRSVLYVHLIAERSVDEEVLAALAEKRDAVQSIVQRMRSARV